MNQFIPENLKGKTYIDPRTDTGFKNLFASKDAIKDFVDGILRLKGDDRIKDLKYSFDEAIRFMVPKDRKCRSSPGISRASRRWGFWSVATATRTRWRMGSTPRTVSSPTPS